MGCCSEPAAAEQKLCSSESAVANGNCSTDENHEVDSASLHATDDDLRLQPSATPGGSKIKPCAKFFSTAGCPYGESCHYLHFVPGGINAVMGYKKNNHGGATGPSVTVNGYKTRLCNRYTTPEGCRFGDNCHFAHGECELRPANTNGTQKTNPCNAPTGEDPNSGFATYPYHPLATSLFYGEPIPPGVTTIPTSSMTRISIGASYAGAIIGRSGSNVRQISRLTGAKISVREHETDPNMKNIEMEGLPDQIQRANEMIRQFLEMKEVRAASPVMSENYNAILYETFTEGTCMGSATV